MFQVVAGKVPAFKTEPHFGFPERFAGLDFAYDARNGFVLIGPSATRAFVLFSQMRDTDSAIHAAGRN